ncbi:MAG: hypothetical protein M3R02_14460 [Chloroflexota bacterium]|nr:hypothetical protein [Chloroflexota bacterium]
MSTHHVEIFGVEYVLMLGAWYAVVVALALLASGLRRVLARRAGVDGGVPARTGTTARTLP